MIALSAAAIDIGLPVIPPMVEALGATSAAGQAIITAYLAGFAIGQIPIGLAGDRWGRRNTTLAAVAGFLICSVIASSASDISTLLAARFAQGLFGAVGPVLARAIARDLAKDGDATELLALLLSILAVTPVLAPLVGAAFYDFAGWRAPFWVLAVYGAALMAGVALLLPETRRAPPARKSANLVRVVQTPNFLRCAAMIGLPHAGYLAFVTASSSILAAEYEVDALGFAGLFAVAAAALSAGGMTTRMLVRTTGGRVLMNIGVACIGVASAGLVLSVAFGILPLVLLWACIVLFIFGQGVAAPLFSAKALEAMDHTAGAAAALMGTLQIMLGFFGSLAVSQLAALGSAGLALVMAGPALCACLLHAVHEGRVRGGERAGRGA